MHKEIVIDNQFIGEGHPPYIIAELSANHNGSIDRALETIDAAYACGANAIKIQTYTADTMTIDCKHDEFMIKGGLWDGYNLYELYKWAETPYEWHQTIFDHAKKLGITVFSTPFDETAVDLLEELNTPAYKIASFEIVDLPLIEYVALKGKPMIISTGMATKSEIEDAINIVKKTGNNQLILLHCISGYPTPINQAHLAQMKALAADFCVPIGLSDHTLGTTVSVSAVALGACVIEKHFTLDRMDNGPDSAFSLEPKDLKELCEDCHDAWVSLGQAKFSRASIEESSKVFRRSLYFVKSLKSGDIIKPTDVRRIRPGFGLAPKYFDQIIGKKLILDVDFGTAVQWEQFDD